MNRRSFFGSLAAIVVAPHVPVAPVQAENNIWFYANGAVISPQLDAKMIAQIMIDEMKRAGMRLPREPK